MEESPTKNSNRDGVQARSDQGLEILKHAFSDGGKVLEFKREDDDMRILDITEHHQELQRMADDE